MLGFEVIKSSIERFFSNQFIEITLFTYIVLIISILSKYIISNILIKFSKKEKSPALKAAGVDAKNDVLSSIVALIGIIGYKFNIIYLDSISGLIIGLIIIKYSIDIGKENIPYLMGESPDKVYYKFIIKKILSVKGVKNVHDLKIHYVGNFYHIEVHIEVDGNLKTKKSHLISNQVQRKIQKLNEVDKVFVHIDPI